MTSITKMYGTINIKYTNVIQSRLILYITNMLFLYSCNNNSLTC